MTECTLLVLNAVVIGDHGRMDGFGAPAVEAFLEVIAQFVKDGISLQGILPALGFALLKDKGLRHFYVGIYLIGIFEHPRWSATLGVIIAGAYDKCTNANLQW